MVSIAMINTRELAIAIAIATVLCTRFIDGQVLGAMVACIHTLW